MAFFNKALYGGVIYTQYGGGYNKTDAVGIIQLAALVIVVYPNLLDPRTHGYCTQCGQSGTQCTVHHGGPAYKALWAFPYLARPLQHFTNERMVYIEVIKPQTCALELMSISFGKISSHKDRRSSKVETLRGHMKRMKRTQDC